MKFYFSIFYDTSPYCGAVSGLGSSLLPALSLTLLATAPPPAPIMYNIYNGDVDPKGVNTQGNLSTKKIDEGYKIGYFIGST